MRFTNRIILILWAIACGPLAACSDGGLMEAFSGDWLDGMADAVEKL